MTNEDVTLDFPYPGLPADAPRTSPSSGQQDLPLSYIRAVIEDLVIYLWTSPSFKCPQVPQFGKESGYGLHACIVKR